MNRTIRFVVEQFFTARFWRLFIAILTIVIMMEWRWVLRDQIFNVARGVK